MISNSVWRRRLDGGREGQRCGKIFSLTAERDTSVEEGFSKVFNVDYLSFRERYDDLQFNLEERPHGHEGQTCRRSSA
jgi:hypothetical protein